MAPQKPKPRVSKALDLVFIVFSFAEMATGVAAGVPILVLCGLVVSFIYWDEMRKWYV